MRGFLILCAAAIMAIGGTTHAADTPKQAEARIPFVNHHGIYDWQAIDRTTLYIEDEHRRWYRATLLNDCIDLPFAETIGFESGADDMLDRFSSIVVRGERCPLTSLVASEAPPKKGKKAPSRSS